MPPCEQSNSRYSNPLHLTLSNMIGPLPCPNAAFSLAIAPSDTVHIQLMSGKFVAITICQTATLMS